MYIIYIYIIVHILLHYSSKYRVLNYIILYYTIQINKTSFTDHILKTNECDMSISIYYVYYYVNAMLYLI